MAAAEESYRERQENEMEVLKAVFMEEVTDLRENDAWKVERPPEIKLKVVPQQSMHGEGEIHAMVNVYVKCQSDYPDSLPTIKVENIKGLSDYQISELQGKLDTMAKTLLGEVMILELAQNAQSFLHAHNKAPIQSFYDEMMKNKKKQEEKIAKDQHKKMELLKKKEEKERLEIEEEIQRHQQALKEENRKRRETRESDDLEQEGKERGEPGTPPMPQRMVTPIPPDTEQRNRCRLSQSPASTPRRTRQDSTGEGAGSYRKPERKRERLNSQSGPEGPPWDDHGWHTSTPRLSGGDREDCECKDHVGTALLAFNTKTERTIHRGKCLGHSPRGSTVFTGMDTASGELVAISEWVLKWRHANRKLKLEQKWQDDQEAVKHMKQVASIEQELLSLIRLRHRNLVHYHAIKYQRNSGKITVYVMMEFCGGGSLDTYLKNKTPVPLERLRQHIIEILEGLAYLHNKAVVHKDIRASSILLDRDGQIRLGDYSLDKRLSDLFEAIDSERPGVHFKEENTRRTIGRGGKKGDIYRLGILIMSLVEGKVITAELPEVPTNFPAELQDFLTKCLIKDERHRWSVHQLLDHNFVKTSLLPSLTINKRVTNETPEKEGNKKESDDESEGSDTEVPVIYSCDASGQSRLNNEFEILKWLGKGGFGDVIKVRNKLDGRLYAIKRIPLNPRSRQFNKKITREVKLLSRLNHENVVRYYNSWIETSDEPVPSDSSSSLTATDSSISKATPPKHNTLDFRPTAIGFDIGNKFKNSLNISDDIEKFAPSFVDKSVEWSISVDDSRVECESSSDDDEDDDDDDDNEDDVFGHSFMPHGDSDDGIVFEATSNFADYIDEESKNLVGGEDHVDNSQSFVEVVPKLQFMYIQMEYCEKSTLRNCIDAGLYEDMNRVWRLFREIIEGLVHIHEQGMIHRDLKPVNIFLDSNDQVKIGDFGLATTDILTKQQSSFMDATLTSTNILDVYYSSSRSGSGSLGLGDGSLTGKVGTALYVSPEMMNSTAKTSYNQKVDIYSLGIMFFEMCFRPLNTGMERVKILSELRKNSIDFPEEFDEIEMPNQALVIRWLLNHDPSLRPTSQELLQSELLPPPQMEEAELNEVLRSTISNPKSKAYKRMIDTMFSQPITPVMEYTYDIDIHKGTYSQKWSLMYRYVTETLEKVFQRHGAVSFETPLLMPKSGFYEANEQYVCFMNHSGGLVALPFDLRVPFARYVARNNVQNLKRYNIEKVYREKKLFGSHPKELTECAFDIITSAPSSLVPDAEAIHVISEIIQEFPVLQSRTYILKINHTSLLKAILMHCGIPEDKHKQVYAILGDTKSERQKKFQVQTRLCSLSLSEQAVASLYNFIEMMGPFSQLDSRLRCITKTKTQAAALAKKGLYELRDIIRHLQTLGSQLQVVLTLGLLHNAQHYSGTVFQIACKAQGKKRKDILDVLAAGSRYDNLIEYFRKPSSLGSSGPVQYGVGVSVAVEKIVLAVLEDSEVPSAYDILLCSLGQKAMVEEKLNVARDLWAAGLRIDIFHDNTQSPEQIQDYCRNAGIGYMVILKDADSGFARVRSIEKDKVMEKKLASSEVAEYLGQKIQAAKMEVCETRDQSSNKTTSLTIQSYIEPSESRSSSSNLPPINITFVSQDNTKLASNAKRKYESTIYSKLSPSLHHFSSRSNVEVIAAELAAAVVRTVAAHVDVEGEEAAFERSVGPVVKEHPRYRKYLTKIFDLIHDLKFDKKCPLVVLYSLKEDIFKVLL